ncbi:vascular endothelial growth factor D [Leptonychotes weddellii]|uniref:Vascular endothelial growth factor D n=1 Tax=Leptonychotes weddellii TaxID=9713 RepID=A0A7F8RBZ8_LEPWE|nr:vascular endothelial growth factor D [Leptonychotes weddellii]
MYRQWAMLNVFMMSYLQLVQGSSYEHGPVKRTSRSTLERSEQQIRAASGLEELLRITHFEDWKLWRCRLKLKSVTSTDSRSASHRATRFAATFYDIETLKGRCVCVRAHMRACKCGRVHARACVDKICDGKICDSHLHKKYKATLLCFRLDHSHLQELALCGPHMKFDEDRCECVCKTLCPRDLIQHPENCSCMECRETLESCCQKHKIFHAETCSCEDRCPFHTRTCANGKPACAKHCRFLKKKAACGLHGQENP